MIMSDPVEQYQKLCEQFGAEVEPLVETALDR